MTSAECQLAALGRSDAATSKLLSGPASRSSKMALQRRREPPQRAQSPPIPSSQVAPRLGRRQRVLNAPTDQLCRSFLAKAALAALAGLASQNRVIGLSTL